MSDRSTVSTDVPRIPVPVPTPTLEPLVLRHALGDRLRRARTAQGRTLRAVSSQARVSLGYLSEVERGQKEASSELLAAICSALELPLSQLLRQVSEDLAVAEGAVARPAVVAAA